MSTPRQHRLWLGSVDGSPAGEAGEHAAAEPSAAAPPNAATTPLKTKGLDLPPTLKILDRKELVATLQATIHDRESALAAATERVATGFRTLDEALQGGLLRGAANEIYVTEAGSGIAEALLPAIQSMAGPSAGESRLDGAAPKRLLAWIHPFRTPYPPALAQMASRGEAAADHHADAGPLARWLIVRPGNQDDHLWAIEQTLRSGACDAVVAHIGDVPDMVLRRIQLAAQEGRALGLFFRPSSAAAKASPAAVRFLARPRPSPDPGARRVEIEIVRCRGTPWAPKLILEWNVDSLDERPSAWSVGRTTDPGLAGGRRRAAGAHGA